MSDLNWHIEQLKKTISDYAISHTGSMFMNEEYESNSKLLQDMLAATPTRQEYDAYRILGELAREIETMKTGFGAHLTRLVEQNQELKSRLDLLTEAIAVSHMKNDDDKCIRGCWACHIIEVMEGLKAARKLMNETK